MRAYMIAFGRPEGWETSHRHLKEAARIEKGMRIFPGGGWLFSFYNHL